VNQVRLYSNGTGVISREYALSGEEPLRISIPVRMGDLDDVVSSLAVFGDVAIIGPPSYTPTNADEPELTLDPSNVLEDLATKLAGASVEIEAGTTYAGRLLGLHRRRREVDGGVIDSCLFVVLTEKGVQRVEVASITAIRFSDAAVQAEIDEALRSSLGRIRPDSSTVELTIRPNPGSTRAVVAYATPVAAWKIRYQFRLSPDGGELEGQAVVDNDTDDDWADSLITVITGEPITFSTDLAEIRRPERGRVNVVADRATGAVAASPVMPMASRRDAPAGMAMSASKVAGYGGGPRTMQSARAVAAAPDLERAEQAQAEVREGGDFSVFTSPEPVNVGAKRSAILPLFREAVGESRVILFYKERDDPQRPFRAVRFRNRAAHSLGRGVCEVFVDGDFQGKSILEPAKPGDEVLLIHAKETGVRVFREPGPPERRRMAIRISEGTVYYEELERAETTYRVQNSHPRPFALEIEHPRALPGSQMKISVSEGEHEGADIPGGRRIRATLGANAGLIVGVVEELVKAQQFSLDASWLLANFVWLNAPATRSQEIEGCIKLQGQIGAIRSEIGEKQEAAKAIVEQQNRLMGLIPLGHDEQANGWRTDLATAEQELRAIQRAAIPELKARLKKAEAALREALDGLRYEWSEAPRAAGRP